MLDVISCSYDFGSDFHCSHSASSADCFTEHHRSMDFCAYESQHVSNKQKIRELVLFRKSSDRTQLDDCNDTYISNI